MKMKTRTLRRLLPHTAAVLSTFALLALFAARTCGGPPKYTVTVLGTLGGDECVGRGINASGQIAGESPVMAPDPLSPVAKCPTHAVRWTGTKAEDLGTLGGITACGYGINASGQVAGTCEFAGATNGRTKRAVRWTGTTGEDLGTLGGRSEARSINASGQVAGSSEIKEGGPNRAVRWTGTKAEVLGTLGGTFSVGMAINDSGQVAGCASLPGGNGCTGYTCHAVRWTGTHPEDLGTLGGSSSAGMAINASGQVVGESQLKGSDVRVKHAVLWTGTKPTDLGTLGGTSSWASGVNAAGDIVGVSRLAGDSNVHPFLYTSGKMYDLIDLLVPGSGVAIFSVEGINDRGQITGFGRIGGHPRALRLDPVAKP
jgi:probable HAF family extracellular repeat protein